MSSFLFIIFIFFAAIVLLNYAALTRGTQKTTPPTPPSTKTPRPLKRRKHPLYATYVEYLNSPIWKEISDLVRSRDSFTCQICGSPNSLNTHHKTYVNVYEEINHLEDLTTLCFSCHDKINHDPIVKTWPTMRGFMRPLTEAEIKVLNDP